MSIKRYILLIILIVSQIAYGQESKTLSTKYALSVGNIKMADHNLSNQEYDGIVYGLQFSQGQ